LRPLLGYPLEEAVALAQAEGYEVITKELTCRKGPVGSDARVIRVIIRDGKAELTYATFTTELHSGREG